MITLIKSYLKVIKKVTKGYKNLAKSYNKLNKLIFGVIFGHFVSLSHEFTAQEQLDNQNTIECLPSLF